MNYLVGYNGFDDGDMLEGYGEQIVGDMEEDDGLDDILAGYGDDGYDDDVGAAPNLRNLLGMLQQVLARGGGQRGRRPRGRRPRGPHLQPVRAKNLRRYPLGLGVTSVAAGAAAIISVQPQLPFKLERLVTAVASFSINNIQVGTVSQFVAAGAVPSEVFAATAFGVELRGDTAVPGVQIQITVTNLTAGALNFSGALLGLVAQ